MAGISFEEFKNIRQADETTLQKELSTIEDELASDMMYPISGARADWLSDFKFHILFEIKRRQLVRNNCTGITDKNRKLICAGHKLKNQFYTIVIDDFGTYCPGSFTYHPDGATNWTAHYPIYNIVTGNKLSNYEIINDNEVKTHNDHQDAVNSILKLREQFKQQLKDSTAYPNVTKVLKHKIIAIGQVLDAIGYNGEPDESLEELINSINE